MVLKVRAKLNNNWFLVICSLFILLVLAWNFGSSVKNSDCLVINNQCRVSLEVVSNDHSRALGLSGRESLPAHEGMLFVFDSPDNQCIWMKDMNFPIDIIWLDSDKKVVYTEENVSPSTYPDSFCSPEATKYVIELGAGQASNLGITLGQTLEF